MDSSSNATADPLANAEAERAAAAAAQRAARRKARTRSLVDPWLYRVPGFIAELTAFIHSVAPAPNLPAAFCGALAFLSYLAGRKYMGENGGALPNLYLVLLGESGCGKDAPRQFIRRLARRLGILDGVLDGFASGQGLIDALRERPLLISQYDEINRLFSILAAQGKDPLSEAISSAMKQVFSSAAGTLRRDNVSARGKADKLPPVVVAPHLTLFGTGTPEEVWGYVTPQMLGDGLAGRMLFVEADPFKGSNFDANMNKPFPQGIVEHAKKLLAGKPDAVETRETFDTEHDFKIVPFAPGGRDAWREFQERNDARRIELGKQSDPLARSRAASRVRRVELAGKCALLFALSENADDPQITPAGIDWAANFVSALQDATFSMVADNYGATPEGKAASKILAKIRERGGEITQTDLGQAFRATTSKKVFDAALEWLATSGESECESIQGRTKPKTVWRIVENAEGDE